MFKIVYSSSRLMHIIENKQGGKTSTYHNKNIMLFKKIPSFPLFLEVKEVYDEFDHKLSFERAMQKEKKNTLVLQEATASGKYCKNELDH